MIKVPGALCRFHCAWQGHPWQGGDAQPEARPAKAGQLLPRRQKYLIFPASGAHGHQRLGLAHPWLAANQEQL